VLTNNSLNHNLLSRKQDSKRDGKRLTTPAVSSLHREPAARLPAAGTATQLCHWEMMNFNISPPGGRKLVQN